MVALSPPGPRPRIAARYAAARLWQTGRAVAGVACTVLSSAAIMAAAWAVTVIPNDGPAQAPASGVVTAGGMPRWQITLIVLGSAVVLVTAGVWLDRTRGRRQAASGRHHLTRPPGRELISRAWIPVRTQARCLPGDLYVGQRAATLIAFPV